MSEENIINLAPAYEHNDPIVPDMSLDNTDTDTREQLIVCDSLVKIYKTSEIEVMALQGLDMVIHKGEFLAVIGKSGSGKSTLMNIVGGLEKPSAGKIVVNGRNLADYSEKEMVEYRSRTVGFVWQNSRRNLYPYLTSLENVEAAMCYSKKSKKEKRKRALELLELTGIIQKKDAIPTRMSGGEQQRVAIAVALANDPDILLADEPTGAVDSKTSDMLQDLFRQLNRMLGITIIIVTHDMKLADKTDRVVMISDGKIGTEKIMKDQFRQQFDKASDINLDFDLHEEYYVMDKAHRVQLSDDILKEAGITGNKVKIRVEDGKVIITG